MKRIPREPERFEVLELFNSIGRKHGFSLGEEESESRFSRTISQSLSATSKNPIFLYGRRAQAMFGYVVASLGRASLVKEEDTGELYVRDPDVRPPDFLVVLEAGPSFLVEVKNCHRDPIKPYNLKGSYLDSLAKYARLVDHPLRIAIYWSRGNRWTLISLERLPRQNGNGVINMLDAIKINEMADLGDLLVATTPPLTWRVLTDPTKPRKVDASGQAVFTIGDFEFYCGNRRIEDKRERNLAFYFMLYGDWVEERDSSEAYIENGNLIHFDFVVSHPAPIAGQEFQIIGALSGMISRRFKDLTAPKATIERLVPSAEPGSLGVVIPEDYKGEHLPLWRFIQRPNYDQWRSTG